MVQHHRQMGQAGRHGPSEHDRIITYNVGWKSGKIHLRDHGSETTEQLRHPATRSVNPVIRAFLREAALPPAKAWPFIIAAVPVVSFAGLCWLVYMLINFD